MMGVQFLIVLGNVERGRSASPRIERFAARDVSKEWRLRLNVSPTK